MVTFPVRKAVKVTTISLPLSVGPGQKLARWRQGGRREGRGSSTGRVSLVVGSGTADGHASRACEVGLSFGDAIMVGFWGLGVR